MSSTIFASKKRKQNVAEKNDNSDIEDDFADESDVNKDGEDSGSEEREDEDSGASETTGPGVGDFQGKEFDISRTVNLESGDLADVLSEKDLPVPRKAIAKKMQAPVAAPKVLSEEDWEM
jgi:hypothetical protein